MKAVIQRVHSASVKVDDQMVGHIGVGLLVLLGVAKGDTETDVNFVVGKISGLRIFPDESGKMNRSILEIQGAILLVSQFTLLGDTARGRRPSFEGAASPNQARDLFNLTMERFQTLGIPIQTGVFGSSMLVSLENDGPVTFTLDSQTR